MTVAAPDPDAVPYAVAWVTLRAARYRCALCRKPTRRVIRDAAGRLAVVCPRRHPPTRKARP